MLAEITQIKHTTAIALRQHRAMQLAQIREAVARVRAAEAEGIQDERQW